MIYLKCSGYFKHFTTVATIHSSGSPAALFIETKIMLNSVISDASKGAKLLTCDLKDFFLATPMDTPNEDTFQRYSS